MPFPAARSVSNLFKCMHYISFLKAFKTLPELCNASTLKIQFHLTSVRHAKPFLLERANVLLSLEPHTYQRSPKARAIFRLVSRKKKNSSAAPHLLRKTQPKHGQPGNCRNEVVLLIAEWNRMTLVRMPWNGTAERLEGWKKKKASVPFKKCFVRGFRFFFSHDTVQA